MGEIPIIASHLFRENAGKMHAVLTRMFGAGHLDLVMDAVQDAFEAALVQWRFTGPPADPSAWLMQVAKRRTISALRRESRSRPLPPELQMIDRNNGQVQPAMLEDHAVDDPQLRLLLACAHPSFSIRKQVAFTLKVLCGFGVQEIASALLMEHGAVKKLLYRAQLELRSIYADRDLPDPEHDIVHMKAVHAVLYLMFNEGYKTTRQSDPLDLDLCYEAIRLARLLLRKDVPGTSDTNALLALMFFNISRFPARVDDEGHPVPIEDQAREKWATVFIAAGHDHLNRSRSDTVPGRYYLEALIASIHCSAKDAGATDWKQLVYLYTLLERIAPSQAVTLNRIVAIGYSEGPHHVLNELQQLVLSGPIVQDHMYFATLADIHRRCNNFDRAAEAYRKAEQLTSSPMDKRFFGRRIQQCNTKINSRQHT